MLVLTRKPGETIVIGDTIVVKFVSLHGKQLRIGIEAPPEVGIYRGEVYERIKSEREAAAAGQRPPEAVPEPVHRAGQATHLITISSQIAQNPTDRPPHVDATE